MRSTTPLHEPPQHIAPTGPDGYARQAPRAQTPCVPTISAMGQIRHDPRGEGPEPGSTRASACVAARVAAGEMGLATAPFAPCGGAITLWLRARRRCIPARRVRELNPRSELATDAASPLARPAYSAPPVQHCNQGRFSYCLHRANLRAESIKVLASPGKQQNSPACICHQSGSGLIREHSRRDTVCTR